MGFWFCAACRWRFASVPLRPQALLPAGAGVQGRREQATALPQFVDVTAVVTCMQIGFLVSQDAGRMGLDWIFGAQAREDETQRYKDSEAGIVIPSPHHPCS